MTVPTPHDRGKGPITVAAVIGGEGGSNSRCSLRSSAGHKQWCQGFRLPYGHSFIGTAV